jgi:hypothetical protein
VTYTTMVVGVYSSDWRFCSAVLLYCSTFLEGTSQSSELKKKVLAILTFFSFSLLVLIAEVLSLDCNLPTRNLCFRISLSLLSLFVKFDSTFRLII